MRPEFRETEWLGQPRDFGVTENMVGIHEIRVGVEADQIHIPVAGIIHRGVGAMVWRIDPEQIVQTFGLRKIIKHLPPEFFESRRVFTVPPEPVAVHFMERPPQYHHAMV